MLSVRMKYKFSPKKGYRFAKNVPEMAQNGQTKPKSSGVTFSVVVDKDTINCP